MHYSKWLEHHSSNTLLHVTETLLIVWTASTDVDLDLVHPQSLLEMLYGLNDPLEGFCNVCEVGNAATNDEDLEQSMGEHHIFIFLLPCVPCLPRQGCPWS